jgi:hypothetical protein
MTDTDHQTPETDTQAEGVAENFIASRPLAALAIALFVGALAARIFMNPAPAPRRHDPLPE